MDFLPPVLSLQQLSCSRCYAGCQASDGEQRAVAILVQLAQATSPGTGPKCMVLWWYDHRQNIARRI